MNTNSGITIFTPVYNRAYCINNAYHSLLEQSYQNFEWIIVDDGSTDDLQKQVNEWIMKRQIEIKYVKVSNGGKMRAHNIAVKLASKPAFFTLDSDDSLKEDALELLWKWFEEIRYDEKYAGVSGLRDCKTVQVNLDYKYVDITNCERRKYGLALDTAECYKTDILKEYPAPEYEGENYISPAIVTNAIGIDGYLVRWYNKKIYNFEFMSDGLTKSGDTKFYKNYRGWASIIFLNSKCKKDEDYKEFAYYRFVKFEQERISTEEIAKCLDTSAESLVDIVKKKPFVINKINSFFAEKGIKRIAIYGLGQEAERFVRFIDDFNFEIVCGIDRKKKNLILPCYSLEDNWGDIDAVLITNKYFIKEIRESIALLSKVDVYSLQEDILPMPWNYYFCDL